MIFQLYNPDCPNLIWDEMKYAALSNMHQLLQTSLKTIPFKIHIALNHVKLKLLFVSKLNQLNLNMSKYAEA